MDFFGCRNTDNTTILQFGSYPSSGTVLYSDDVLTTPELRELYAETAADAVPVTSWFLWLGSWNSNKAEGSKLIAYYLNGSQVSLTKIDTGPAFDTPYDTATSTTIGADSIGAAFQFPYIGDAANFMLWTTATIVQNDGTISPADIENFIVAGKPVDPATAIAAYGNASFAFIGDASTFSTNQGTGGAFILTGILTDATTSPSDDPVEPYHADAVHFDGTTALYRSSAFSGATESPNGIYFVWVKYAPADIPMSGTMNFIVTLGGLVLGYPDASLTYNYLFPSSNNPIPGSVVPYFQLTNDDYSSDIGYYANQDIADGDWHLIATTWQTDFSSGSRVVQILIDQTLKSIVVDFEDGGAFDVAWDEVGMCVGSAGFANNAGSPELATPILKCDLSDQYLNISEAVDLSDSAVVAKIIDGSGKPVSLGSNGSLLTGSAPMLYLSGDATTYQGNLSGAGALSVFGTLTDASTSPSD